VRTRKKPFKAAVHSSGEMVKDTFPEQKIPDREWIKVYLKATAQQTKYQEKKTSVKRLWNSFDTVKPSPVSTLAVSKSESPPKKPFEDLKVENDEVIIKEETKVDP